MQLKMAFALVLIFFLVLIFNILPEFLPALSKKMVNLVVTESTEDVKLREEYQQSQNEIRNIRMVDEFAKYARAERKLKKLKDEISKQNQSKSDVFLKLKLGVNAFFHVVQMVCFLGIIYTYRSTALLKLPHDWLYPLNPIISFPTGLSGAVSVTFWLLVCRTVVKKIVDLRTR